MKARIYILAFIFFKIRVFFVSRRPFTLAQSEWSARYKINHILGILAHEYAHHYLYLHNIRKEKEWTNELMTDIAAIYLGLGSVRLKDSDRPGIGTEWRKADSPMNQSIEINSQKKYIISDNAKALINLYNKLGNTDDKFTFVNSLLDRLSKDKEYAPVGYLIFLVLFRIDKLEIAFDIARKKLYQDSSYGFSDSLRLLDGLLRFEHSAFSKKLLEKIEIFIDELDEHLFRIPERLSAIRAFRLNNPTTNN